MLQLYSRIIFMVSTLLFYALAQGMTEEEYNAGVSAINSKYQSTYDAAAKEGEDIKKESDTCLIEGSFDADWEVTRVSFDVPEVSFNIREFSFDTVKTTFNTKTISKTKIPKTYFEVKDVGLGIKTKVPVVRWEIDEVKTKVPEFKWETTSFKTKIPEFRSKRIEWKFHILKIKKLKELSIPCKKEQERADNLSASMDATTKQHERELNKHTATYLAFNADLLADDIVKAESEFDAGIASMDQAIADVRANGIDPAAVSVEFEGIETTMPGARDMLVAKKAEALTQMRAAHQQLLDNVQQLTG